MMPRCRKSHRSQAALLAAALLAAVPASASAQQSVGSPYPTAASARAHRLVGSNTSLIALYMYPASTLDTTQCVARTELFGGEFEMVYRFHFQGNGLWDPFYGEQIFRFDRNGRLLSTRSGRHNTTWEPGAAAETFLDVVRAIVRTKLDPGSATSQAAMGLIDQARVRDLLVLVMQCTEPEPPPSAPPAVIFVPQAVPPPQPPAPPTAPAQRAPLGDSLPLPSDIG